MAKPYAHRDDLAADLEKERKARGLSYAQLGSATGVDTAQALRICNGAFVTLSPNVLKVCRALSVAPKVDDMRLPVVQATQAAARLQSELMAAWDQTPEGASKLIGLLRAAKRLRPQP